MLTNPHDAFRGRSRSPNTVPFGYITHGFLLVCYSNFVPKTHRFEIFDFEKCRDLEIAEIRVNGHSRSSEPTRIDPPFMTYYYRYTATMSLSCTVSEINGDFSRKSPIFSPPCI